MRVLMAGWSHEKLLRKLDQERRMLSMAVSDNDFQDVKARNKKIDALQKELDRR